MKITGIAGTTYLCSKFVNHDGTLVSDHPLYLFNTDDANVWVGVMFTSKTNPFTTHWKDGHDLQFTCCSDHAGEFPTKKVFQAEVYIINKADKDLKYSEYTFQKFIYNQELLKALRNALNEGISTGYAFGITSVHDYNNKDDRADKVEVITNLKEYVDSIISKCCYTVCPEFGPVNTEYSDFKKWQNESRIKNNNQKIFRDRNGRN